MTTPPTPPTLFDVLLNAVIKSTEMVKQLLLCIEEADTIEELRDMVAAIERATGLTPDTLEQRKQEVIDAIQELRKDLHKRSQ